MNSFFIGLQFLTRLSLVKQTEWTAENFGRSVKFFPLIGGVIGILLVGLYDVGVRYLPEHFLAAVVLAAWILLTGGLHCDGFMDTMDGVFSGRSRERMLEIMKDSRVGANGVVGFGLLMLGKWSLLLDMDSSAAPFALFAAPVIGRMAMTFAITCFPYARPEGIGKAFAVFAGPRTFYIALFCTLLLVAPLGATGLAALTAAAVFAAVFARYISRALGGLTGDVYGAVTELTELVALAMFLLPVPIG